LLLFLISILASCKKFNFLKSGIRIRIWIRIEQKCWIRIKSIRIHNPGTNYEKGVHRIPERMQIEPEVPGHQVQIGGSERISAGIAQRGDDPAPLLSRANHMAGGQQDGTPHDPVDVRLKITKR
jgi:hypothetical protein